MEKTRVVGEAALLSDLLSVTFSTSNIFVKDELVLVPRTKGGFTYGRVRKIASKQQTCYMDKEVRHVYPEYRIIVEDDSDTTKGLPACYIGRINNDESPSNNYPNQPTARELGGRPLADDLRIMWFGIPKATPRAGEFVLVPRSKGGFCYGAIAKQVSGVSCPISDNPRHAGIAWRAFLEDKTEKPLHKDLPAIFVGYLRNPYEEVTKPHPQTSLASVSSKAKANGDFKCGECEDAFATLECMNCREFYCAECSDLVHQKGQRKLHTAINPIIRQKAQIVTSASTAGQQMISIAKGKGPTPVADLSSIFAPMPTDYVPAPSSALFPSASYTPSPFLSPHKNEKPTTNDGDGDGDGDDDEDEKSEVKGPGSQKAIFPKRTNSPSSSKVIISRPTENSDKSASTSFASQQKAIFQKPTGSGSGSVIKTGSFVMKNPVIVPVSFSFDDDAYEDKDNDDYDDDDDYDDEVKTKVALKKKLMKSVGEEEESGLSDIKTLKRPQTEGSSGKKKIDEATTDIQTLKRAPLKTPSKSGGISDAVTMKRPQQQQQQQQQQPKIASEVKSKGSFSAPISDAVTLKRPSGLKIVPVKPMSFLDSDDDNDDYEDDDYDE